MKLSHAVLIAVLLSCCASYGAAYLMPNPCPIPHGKSMSTKCKKPLVCGTRAFWKNAICVKPPVPKPNCICPLIFKPVCCRARTGFGFVTVTQTESNSCSCGCLGGTVLFESQCSNPPHKKPCPKIYMPTCCYVPKFDLTFTAGNQCVCQGSDGIVLGKGTCHH